MHRTQLRDTAMIYPTCQCLAYIFVGQCYAAYSVVIKSGILGISRVDCGKHCFFYAIKKAKCIFVF